ncbi:MAG TPA: NACHT domain-containing protein [Solirubrobacterales bacterium]|nr:NACHT domain-containing protein [Solirubrobacterales bacterium]
MRTLLTSIAVRAAERVWALAASARRRDPLERDVERAIAATDFGELEKSLDPEVLDAFLSSPDVAGIVDRLLAFRLLAAEYRRAGAKELDRISKSKPAAPKAERVRPSEEKKNEVSWREAARLRETERTSRETMTYEAQEAALKRECVRVTQLWFGPDLPGETVTESVHAALCRVAETACEGIVRSGGKASELNPSLKRWLSSVEPRVQLLDQLSSIRPFLEFESQLRLQVAASHSSLIAPHLGREIRAARDAVYVPPDFRPWRSRDGDELVASADLMARIDRTVVLGDPGAGKSSFGGSVCHHLATAYDDRLVGGRLLTPLMVAVREYGDELRHESLASLLEKVVQANYQVEAPKDAIRYLLSQGRLLVVFDGLDELSEVVDRRRLRDAIERFCEMYPMTHVLVTARNIGYEHAELNRADFDIFELQQFNDQQVARYCERWFGLQVELSESLRKRNADAFLAESAQHASDLRRNPLLLSLLCGIYAGEGTLPTSRPKVYQRCVSLLLGQWDALRQLDVKELPLAELHLRRTLRQIADWLYKEPDLGRGMPEAMLVRRCATYLSKVLTADLDEATKVAEGLTDFCRDRTWVLVNVGHDASGEPLFGFSHGTFLEFFAAQHLEKQSRTPADLAGTLTEMIRGSASVIPHLALQLADDARDDAADEILTLIIGDAEEESDKTKEDLLLFVVEALRFVIPLPRTPRRLARDTALGLLQPTLVDTTSYSGAIRSSPWPAVADRLGAIAAGNVRAAATGFVEGLKHAVRPEDRDDAIATLRAGVERQPPVLLEAWRAHYPSLFEAG